MTHQDIIDHWKKGSKDALEAAKACFEKGLYEATLFHCHLALEKELKALYMQNNQEEHPRTHDLVYLASLIYSDLGTNDTALLEELSGFVIDARYSDPYWAAEQANETNAQHWITETERLLSSLNVS